MKINYAITGIDDDGNMKLDLPIAADRAIAILFEEVAAGRAQISVCNAPEFPEVEIAEVRTRKDPKPKKKKTHTPPRAERRYA